MRGKKNKRINARISEYDYDQIKRSDYSYSDAIEYFVDNVLNNTGTQLLAELHHKKERREKINNELLDLDLEINNLEYKLDEKGLLHHLPPQVEKTVQTTLNIFNRQGYVNGGDIEEFMTSTPKELRAIIEQQQFKSGLDPQEFKEAVIKEHKRKNKV